jgi:capsular exopolysaccharide synthesis family protein
MNRNRLDRLDPQPPVNIPAGSEQGPYAILAAIGRRWWLVAAAVAVCLVIAGLKAVTTPLLFDTTTTLYIQESAGLGNNNSSNQGAVNLYAECERIKSTPVLVLALGLDDIRTLPTFAAAKNPLEVLRNNVTADLGREDQLVKVSYLSRNEDDSVKINNAIIKAYKQLTEERTQSRAADLLKQVRQEKNKGEQEVEAKSQALLEFQDKNGMLTPGNGKSSLVEDRLTSLSTALTQAHLQTLSDQSEYERLSKAVQDDPGVTRQLNHLAAQGPDALPLATDETQIRADLYQLQQRLKYLSQHYLPDHPLVVAVRDEIDQRNAAYFLAVKQRYLDDQKREQDLQASYDQQHQIALDLQRKQMEYARLQDDLTRSRKRADDWEDRIKQFSLSDDIPPVVTTVIAQETQPKSRFAITIFEGLLIGLMVGVGLTFLDTRFRSADEIRAGVGLAILGAVPHTHGRQSNSIRGRKVHLDPTSEVAEAYRSVRTALYFGATDAETRTLLITSPSEADGKSTLCANLAIAMAQAGQRTLLIDADFRKPQQHKIFQVDDSLGLSMILAGQNSPSETIQRSGIRELDVLPAGPIPPNPTEILNSETFESLLRDLAGQYDHVLIDAPPVAPVSDARILSAMCDATILVLRAQKSSRKSAAHARDALLSVGGNILGIVVNDVPRRKLRYGAFGLYSGAHYGSAKREFTRATV